MDPEKEPNETSLHNGQPAAVAIQPKDAKAKEPRWKGLFSGSRLAPDPSSSGASSDGDEEIKAKPARWNMGILNDKETEEVPGIQPKALRYRIKQSLVQISAWLRETPNLKDVWSRWEIG